MRLPFRSPGGQIEEGRDVFIHQVVEILSQCTHVWNRRGVHFKHLTVLPVSYLPRKAEKKRISGCSGLREGNKQSSTEDFQGNENLGDDTVTCVIYIVTRVSTLTEWTPPRGNSNVNRGLWWWCVSAGSSAVTDVPLWWGCWWWGGCACVEAKGSLWTFCSILLWTQLLWKQSPCLKLLSLQAVLIPLYCPVNRGLPVEGVSQFTAVWLNWARINSVTVFIRISLKLQLCLIPTQQAEKPFPKAILKMCPDCRELGVLSDTVTTSGQAFLFGAMKMF